MRWVLFILVTLAFSSRAVPAAELVMFESSACEWCMMWDEEVGVVYDKTGESRVAPLRRVDFHDPRPPELQDLKQIVYTPTFVLVDNGREVGRITGYPGEAHFWALLEILIKDMERPVFGCARTKKLTKGEPAVANGATAC